MTTAFATVPAPVATDRTDKAEDFLVDVYRIGEAWTSQVGGWGGIHIQGRGGAYIARWGSHGGPTGAGACIVDALLDLARKLAKDLRDWAAESAANGDEDLATALEVSIAIARVEANR